MTSEVVSMAQHPGYAGVHLLFFNKFASGDLVDSQLHSLGEPFLFRQQPVNGFDDEFVRAPPGAR